MRIEKLGNMISITKGKKYQETYDVNAPRYLQIEDVNGAENHKFTYEKGVQVNSDDIILVWDGANAGKVGIGLVGIIGSTLARMSLDTKTVFPKYLFWFLNSKFDLIKSQRTGATIPHVSPSAIRNLPVPLFSLPEQQRIATILDHADSIRFKNGQILEKYNVLARSVFYEMFGDFKSNPNHFLISSIGSECEVKGGKRVPKGDQLVTYNTGHPYIKAGNIKNGNITSKDIEYIPVSTHQKIKRYIVHKGDVCITIVGVNIGDIGVVPDEFDCANLTENAAKLLIKDKTKLNNIYLANYLQLAKVKESIVRRTMAVGVPKLALFRIEEIEIIIPPLKLQEQYNEVLNLSDIQKELVRIGLEKSEELFQSLLQKAFKGEL